MKSQVEFASSQYSVAGLVVHCLPKNSDAVVKRLTDLHGVEVHGGSPEGKLVVTVEEQPGEKFIMDRISEINNTQGVVNTALVYSQSESLELEPEPEVKPPTQQEPANPQHEQHAHQANT